MGKAGCWVDALTVLWEMLQGGLTPSVVTCNAALLSCCSVHHGKLWGMALRVFHATPRFHVTPDLLTCSTLLRACEEGRGLHVGQEMLADMQQRLFQFAQKGC